jgi:hypothetical protein
MKIFEKIKPVYILIILLSLISQRYLYNVVLYPQIEWRIYSMQQTLRSEYEPPYQYRVLKPAICAALDKVLSAVMSDQTERYKLIFKFLLLVMFYFLFLYFYKFLRIFYSNSTAIIGLLLLQTALPLTITDNCWEEGDVVNLFFYILAFYFMFKQKDYFIPLIIAIGTTNREQAVFMLVFYAAYLYEQKRLFTLKSLAIIVSSVIIFLLVYFGLRMYFGYMPNLYIGKRVPLANLSHWYSILRLWVEQVFIFVIVCIIVYKKSSLFFRLSLLCLIPFTILYFFYGIMGELAKYLPAFLILITMSLQIIKGEYTLNSDANVQKGIIAG